MTREALLWSNRLGVALIWPKILPKNHEGTILNSKWNLGQFHFTSEVIICTHYYLHGLLTVARFCFPFMGFFTSFYTLTG